MRRVLVVEDEAAIREVIALNLRMAGYDVTEAGSAEAGLAAIGGSAPFDVAVLDIMLPGMNGFSLCENIRRDSDSIGIIMLSAKSQEDDKIRGLSIGADDYMTKPFSVSELLARVDALCRRVARAAGQDGGQEAEGRMVSGSFVLDQKAASCIKTASPSTSRRWNFKLWSCFSQTPAWRWCAKRFWKAYGAKIIMAMSRLWM